jgi:bisphosphoglycerate-independent phosphoglycerate mutase (AlkP superfamily)
MSEQYLRAIEHADGCIGTLLESFPTNTTVLVTSDHGGHDQTHGTPSSEDMTIPFIMAGEGLQKGELGHVHITDIAPTIAKRLELKAPKEWTGKALI